MSEHCCKTDACRIKDLEAERDRLKAELEKLSCPICGSDVEGHNWKSKAEKLAQALDNMLGWQSLAPVTIQDQAKEALAEFEK